MNPPSPISLTIVIATMDRPDALREVFESIDRQTVAPKKVIIVDASTDEQTRQLCHSWEALIPLNYERATRRSAARQRNQGAANCDTELICFMDDDVVFPEQILETLCAPFATPTVGGVAGRIQGLSHTRPGRLLHAYYRMQAGYPHAHYGARVIGPAINLLPAYDEEPSPLIKSEWLNSTLVVYRRELFAKEKFPDFEGYSFLEDVHLSYRVGKTHTLYFHRDAVYVHNSRPSSEKSDKAALARMCVRHQRIVSTQLLGLHGIRLTWKLFLHRLFQSIVVIRASGLIGFRDAVGFWQA